MVVGLSLAAVLFIVIPLGTYSHNWPWEITKTCISLSSAGLYLYFWIVVLELFIKMVPMPMIFDPAFGGPVPPPLPPGINNFGSEVFFFKLVVRENKRCSSSFSTL